MTTDEATGRELDALANIAEELDPLDDDARRRIVVWMWDRYGPPMMELEGEVEMTAAADDV